MNSNVHFVDGGVLINLGQRESSNIPMDLPISEWFGNEQWIKHYRLSYVKHKFKSMVVSTIHSRYLRRFFLTIFCVIAVGLAVQVQKKINGNILSSPSMTNEVIAKKDTRMSSGVIRSVNANNSNVTAATQTQAPELIEWPAHESRSNKVASEDVRSKPATLNRTSDDISEKLKRAELALPKSFLKAPSKTVKPPIPEKSEALVKSENLVRKVGSSQLTAEEKPMMVIQDVEPAKEIVQSPKIALESSEKQTTAIENVKLEQPKEPSKQLPLPSYKIITVTKNSIVIADPVTKMPKQIFVGKELPSGEIIKSVNEDKGTVVTNSRILKM